MYKLILLDYCMPVMKGPETALAIRQIIGENNLDQPFISCCSAYDQKTYVDRAFKSGMQSFITKPIKHADMLTLLE